MLGTSAGCQMIRDHLPFSGQKGTPAPHMRRPVVERIQAMVQPELSRHLADHEAEVLKNMAAAASRPAQHKPALLVQGLSDPWPSLARLERHSLLAAELAEGNIEAIPGLLDILEAGLDRTAVSFSPVPFPSSMAGDELIAFFTDVLKETYEDREHALRHLSQDDRAFLHGHAASVVEHFTPHLSVLSRTQESVKQHDVAFARLLVEQVDYSNMITAAQRLTRLGNETFLRRLAVAFSNKSPITTSIPGITGDVLLARHTSYGLMIIGGSGPNTYDLDARFSLVIDLGGNDSYRGSIGASANLELGHSVVIDLGGNDQYEPSPLGLATGRLGIGVVIDLAGNDVYHLAPGSGGTGFAGLGILYDGRGNDQYIGSRFTQGAAAGGLGLLVDRSGDDRYSIDGYGIWLGAWLGVGAVIDGEGDDAYRCGGRYPSSYNDTEQPTARPGDAGFQYDCFGLGVGIGSRVMGSAAVQAAYNMAGGWGLLLDIAGHDRYQSDNFSQGLGYFFGMGTKLDLDGDDVHLAARYGHGASAHQGLGLFLDRHGNDRYESSGPFYNGAAAWDSSLALMIDAGSGQDQYLLALSTGLGIADHGAWAVCVDEAGADRYLISQGQGWAGDRSLAAFIDLQGPDSYEDHSNPSGDTRGNARSRLEGDRGLFLDK
ncbi:MAG TPA: hypothetical protein VHF07_05515 [Nitrospiraceae bacterium]|nr:hypothetical protein [Nitrospiraceae bacterium]